MLLRPASSSLKRFPASLPATDSSDAARNCTIVNINLNEFTNSPQRLLIVVLVVRNLQSAEACNAAGKLLPADMCSAGQICGKQTSRRDMMVTHPVGGVLAAGEAVPDLLGGEHALIAGGARLPRLRGVGALRVQPHEAPATAATSELQGWWAASLRGAS